MPFTPDRSTVHDLVFGDGVVLVVHTGASACCLTLDDVNLHVLNLNPHQQEIDLPHNYIFQMVPTVGVKRRQAEIRQRVLDNK